MNSKFHTKVLLKIFDFIFQSSIIFMYFAAKSAFFVIIPLFFLIPYQGLSSIIIASSQLLQKQITKSVIIRLILISLILLFYGANQWANSSCLFLGDFITFSRQYTEIQKTSYENERSKCRIPYPEPVFAVQSEKQSYEEGRGPYEEEIIKRSFCEEISTHNDLFFEEFVLVWIVAPLFWFLTFSDRVLDIFKNKERIPDSNE